MTKTTEYKNTAIGPIPIDWEVNKFNDFSKFYSGGTPLTSKPQYYGGVIPFIKSGEIYYNKTEQFLTEEGLSNSSAKMVSKGDLLYALYGANSGEVAISQIEGAINQAILCINQNKNKAETIYLYNYLIFQKDIIIKKYLQGGQGNLSADIIKKLQIPLPPIPEQRKIAEVLSTWDKAIQETDAIIKKLEDRNKGLATNLLTGKSRITGFKDKWKSLKVKDIFKEVRDVNDGEEFHTALTISAKKGFVSQEDKFDRVIAGQSLKKYTLLKKGDYAYNKGNSKTYEYGCIYTLNDYESALVPFVYICFRPIIDICNDFYSHWFLNHNLDNQLRKIITSGARGDGLLNVSRNDFFNLFIEAPSIEEQNAIAEILNTANQEVKQYQQKLEVLTLQKKGLMQQLLTGKVRTI